MKEVILPLVKEKHENGDETTETLLNSLERVLTHNRNVFEKEKVASGPGLFTHKRLDDCVQYCDRA